MDWIESKEAIGQVDELLASVGLGHGRRKTLGGTWEGGERKGRKKAETALKSVTSGKAKAVQAAGWEKYKWLRHGFSARAGGVSAIYDQGSGKGSLNLGWTKEDEAENVAENRRRFLREVAGSKTARLVTLRQFHSGMLRIIGPEGVEGGDVTPPPTSQSRDMGRPVLETPEGRAVLRGDGVMTDVPGVMLGVQV